MAATLPPRVTVIMATYNWAPVLPYSIGSVLDQTLTDFELLVIGDGCTDESGEVVAAISDARVRWHNLPANTGHQSGPNNEGIRQARGDVIAYLGHDDLWLPHHLEVLLEAVDAGARFVHATTLAVPPGRRPLPFPRRAWVYKRGGSLPPTSVMHDRALAEEIGGWRMPGDTGHLAPDSDFWQRLTAVWQSPRWIPRVTSVRLPAVRRRGVYRDRPNHEQAYWLRRIREADDPEASMLAACEERYVYADRSWRAQSDRLIAALRRHVRLRTRLRRLGLVSPASGSFNRQRRAKRRFKGLDV